MRNYYEVIVGNIGKVYSGHSSVEANETYQEYADMSERGFGRAGNESVTLLKNDEIVIEHTGKIETA